MTAADTSSCNIRRVKMFRKILSKAEIAKLAEETGMTPDEAKKIVEILEDHRVEWGEEAYREFVDGCKEITTMAKADGVPLSAMVDALSRRKS
jgi:hypothetical protein